MTNGTGTPKIGAKTLKADSQMVKPGLVEHVYWAQRTGHVNNLPVSVAAKTIYSLFYLHLFNSAEATCVTGSFVSHKKINKWTREPMKPFGDLFNRVLFDMTYDVVALDKKLAGSVEAKFASDGNVRAVEFRIKIRRPVKIPPPHSTASLAI